MIFDGDCGFCRRSVRSFKSLTGEAVEYIPQQAPECRERFPELDPEALQRSVHVVEPNGKVTSGAEAVVRALATNPRWRWPAGVYARSRLAASVLEWGYAFVARHRMLFSRISRPFLRE